MPTKEDVWSEIRMPETFTSLVHALLAHFDQTIRLFTRGGPDGAQDAASADGRTVYQAKFHVEPSASKTIHDAKSELAKIVKYKSKGHGNSALWRDVSNWILVTNAEFNANDYARWDNEVAGLFHEVGIKAELWGEARIRALLDDDPQVRRAYIEGETRSFLTLPEKLLATQTEDLTAVDDQPTISFIGRQESLNAIRKFLIGDEKVM
jgi:hypothetical protein